MRLSPCGGEEEGELTVPAARVVGALAEAREHPIALRPAALETSTSGWRGRELCAKGTRQKETCSEEYSPKRWPDVLQSWRVVV